MTDGFTIYHNPRCTTSRKTLDLLRDNGIEPEVVQYLKTPPSRGSVTRSTGIRLRTSVDDLAGDLSRLVGALRCSGIGVRPYAVVRMPCRPESAQARSALRSPPPGPADPGRG